jgi:ABC-type spermidine/putrescine transport system permease subunit I
MNQTRQSPWRPWLLSAPAVGLWVALFLVPLALLVRVSLYESGDALYRPGTLTAAAYAELVGEPFGRGVVAFTVGLGVGVAALSVLIGYPLAFYIHTLPPRRRLLALAAVVLPKLANVFVVLYGVNLLLGNAGPVNRSLRWLGVIADPLPLTHNLAGVVIAETYLILPWAVLVLVPAFDRIDPNLVPAARGLGATRWQAFRRVTVPLSLPGVAVAGQLCLIWALGAFVGPVLLGGPEQTTLAVQVQRRGLEYGDWPRAAAAAVLSLVTLGVCVALSARLGRAVVGGGEKSVL